MSETRARDIEDVIRNIADFGILSAQDEELRQVVECFEAELSERPNRMETCVWCGGQAPPASSYCSDQCRRESEAVDLDDSDADRCCTTTVNVNAKQQ